MSPPGGLLTRVDAPRAIGIALGALLALIGAHLVHSLIGFGGGGVATFFDVWVYDAVTVGCAALCLARGVLRDPARLAWLCLGVGLSCDAAGEVLASISESLAPTVQSALYLGFYVGAYLAIVLLGRRHVRHFHVSMWLDGLIGAFAIGALGAAALATRGFLTSQSGGVRSALDVSYPLADVLLVGVVVTMFALGGWRVYRSFLVLALGFLLMASADVVYLFEEAHGSYAVGTPLDSLWLLSVAILAYAAWQPDRERVHERHSLVAIMAAPVSCGLIAIGVLLYDSLAGIAGASTWLAAATLAIVLARLLATASENLRLVATSATLANRDALTGLRNRRALLVDLERAAAGASASHPKLMLLFDLNGFKRYNDTFGHPAGDALLARLGQRLAERAGERGRAYRLGGDEFCALIELAPEPRETNGAAQRPPREPQQIAADLAGSLLDSGEHFTIGACYGEVLLGAETRDPTEALRIADQRLYAQKTLQREPSRPEWRDVLLGLLRERDPDLDTHVQQVARLAQRFGRELGLSGDELKTLIAAAELHDVGKTAIPEAILDKPSALDAQERSFIERHTLIGERIIAAAPTGRPVAAIVRATHERYDGHGYPDRLAGEQIPLAARIIAICDAYEAMTSTRSYRAAMPRHEAIAELRRCAGGQFDPQLTETFLRILAREPQDDGEERGSAEPAMRVYQRATGSGRSQLDGEGPPGRDRHLLCSRQRPRRTRPRLAGGQPACGRVDAERIATALRCLRRAAQLQHHVPVREAQARADQRAGSNRCAPAGRAAPARASTDAGASTGAGAAAAVARPPSPAAGRRGHGEEGAVVGGFVVGLFA
jgi:two-component system cell cycle response regulator